MAILFLIGQCKEEPKIIDELLDANRWPCKPQYNITSELPLVLFDSTYKNIEWICEQDDLEKIIKTFQDLWLDHNIKAQMLKRMIDTLENDYEQKLKSINFNQNQDELNKNNKKTSADMYDNRRMLNQPYFPLLGKTTPLTYIKLKDRDTAKSLENRVDFYVKRNKIDKKIAEEKIEIEKQHLKSKEKSE